MSSVEFKFFTMRNVDFEVRVSSVDLEYKLVKQFLTLMSGKKNRQCQVSGKNPLWALITLCVYVWKLLDL